MDKPLISPRRILILDDDTSCREIWQIVCEDLWPQALCIHAATLAEAVTQTDADLVLSDLSLTDSRPRATVHALVAAFPVDVPLVLISGSVVRMEGYELLRLGADAFFLKGRDVAELTQILYTTWVAHCGRRVRAAHKTPPSAPLPHDGTS